MSPISTFAVLGDRLTMLPKLLHGAVFLYSFTALALFYWIIDVKRWQRWTFFFRVIGMNAIAIYMLMKFVGFGAISKEDVPPTKTQYSSKAATTS